MAATQIKARDAGSSAATDELEESVARENATAAAPAIGESKAKLRSSGN